MAATGELRIYNDDRALHLPRRIQGALEARHAEGTAVFLGATPSDGVRRVQPGEIVFSVAPPLDSPIYEAPRLNRFRRGLTPGIQPDMSFDSAGSWSDQQGGLYFGSSFYEGVPGYTLYQGRVTESPVNAARANPTALAELVQRTGRPAEELVTTTTIRVFPHAELGALVHEYERGLAAREYPFARSLDGYASMLDRHELQALRTDPSAFVDASLAYLQESIDDHVVGINTRLVQI